MAVTGIGTVTGRGLVTVPRHVRDALGVTAGDRLIFGVEGDRVFFTKLGRESLAVIFQRQKPWKLRAIPAQRTTRSEWADRHP
jgi:bifunctional DNA-binding transcriptional regulator/antitoxin component of YhaV-PrlF toxin-antitoxin module